MERSKFLDKLFCEKMPLPKRIIEPVFVARSRFAREDHLNVPTELETVTNTTLTNIIRQLSSLSKHSEDLFGELTREAGHLSERSNSLQARVDRLAIKVTQLDSNVEEVSLQDIQLKKAFKSANIFDQQIFSRSTMPAAMLETYLVREIFSIFTLKWCFSLNFFLMDFFIGISSNAINRHHWTN